MAVGVPWLAGICAAGLVLVLGAQHDRVPVVRADVAVPDELAGYSHLTGTVSDSAPGAAVALFQHGFGVELLDFPQAVVLGAGGDSYRRVDVAEDRAGPETQGDPAPMLLSPDGTRVAVGDHDTARPDVVIVDLVTGTSTSHPQPKGRSVVPVAWSSDGRTLASLLSPEPTNPYSSGRITGEVGLLDVEEDSTVVVPGDTAAAAAFSPDGADLAVERVGGADDGVSVVDLGSGLRADGVLAGPAAWSPDGRLLAVTTVRPSDAPAGDNDPGVPTGLAFVDPTGGGGDVPAPLELPLSGPGRVLGWTGPDAVLLLLAVEGSDPCCGPEADELSGVPLDGGTPRTLMRIPDLQDYGVGRFQMASATVGDLRVVTPDDVDRGPWPLPWRGGLALVAGLLVWLVVRVAQRRFTVRRR